MSHPSGRSVKIAQKEAQFFREFSQLFMQLCMDQPALNTLTISRVVLSDDKGVCSIFFFSTLGEDDYNEKRKILVLYKPSMRAALAKRIPGRYTPRLVFKFDQTFAKQKRLEELLDSIKEKP